jgi:hypothetical protein
MTAATKTQKQTSDDEGYTKHKAISITINNSKSSPKQFPKHQTPAYTTRMKFGEHLKANIAPEYGPDPYLHYERLDQIISQLSETKPSRYDALCVQYMYSIVTHWGEVRSICLLGCLYLSVSWLCLYNALRYQTPHKPYLSHLSLSLDPYASAIETSRVLSMTAPPPTNAQGLDTSNVPITEEHFLRSLEQEMVKVETFTLQQVTQLREKMNATESLADKSLILKGADEIAQDFLRLEKYVNINFMGFHKILKKHGTKICENVRHAVVMIVMG